MRRSRRRSRANAAGSLGVHDLKTRQAAAVIFVDFHMVVPADMTVGEAHDLRPAGRGDRGVNAAAHVAIHIEPEGEKAHGIRVMVMKD